MATQPVLIDGNWREADAIGTFQAVNPNTCETHEDRYPVSRWCDVDAALDAAVAAFQQLRKMPSESVANFLEAMAHRIEQRSSELVDMAFAETGLPKSPRLADVELPRTTGQLRQAAAAARSQSWREATLDTKTNIRSGYLAIGPVAVFGPNNFPFAFGSVSGGDFAAAIAAGNPVIGKANSSHPGTTRLFAEAALEAIQETGMPSGLVQLIYRTEHSDGERLAADPRLGAIGYTGARNAGLKLKTAADRVGKPIYLELSSINPVVILPEALNERGDELVTEFSSSCLMGAGQFCTNPGLILVLDSDTSRDWVAKVGAAFDESGCGTLLSPGVEDGLKNSVKQLLDAGATQVTTRNDSDSGRCSFPNTLLTVRGSEFVNDPETFQTEAFGNESLVVTCQDEQEMVAVIRSLEGNLTGCVYSATNGGDDSLYDLIEPELRQRVGRLLNDKMPTGVAVSPAMNHGGPFPATGHPGFTAVGIPGSLRRFAMLACYDAVRSNRLPKWLQDDPGNPETWRLVDGNWQQGPLG